MDCGGGKRFQPDNMLLAKTKRDAARRKYSQPRGFTAERLDEVGARFHQVFAVIQY